MNTPLVSPVDSNSSEESRTMAQFYKETLGFTPNSLFTMMHRPRIAHAFVEMNQAVMENKGRVTSGLKRLIGFIASMNAGCRYCEAHTVRAADRYGCRPGQIENIWEYKTHDAFNDAERAALDLALQASTVPNSVNQELSDELRKHWNDGEIVEILGVIALFGYLNRWNDSMGTQLEEPAAEDGVNFLSKKGWSRGKHQY